MTVQELRRAFRLEALHLAGLITERQSLANEALLVWSHPHELFFTHAEIPGRSYPPEDTAPK